MSHRVLNLMQQAVGQPQAQILYGEVSLFQPPPTSFTSPLYVVVPDWSPDYYYLIEEWPALHGTTLPSPGAACLLVLDNQGTMWCVSWQGTYSYPAPSGSKLTLP